MWWLAAHGRFICSRECGGSGQIRPILLDQNGIFDDLDLQVVTARAPPRLLAAVMCLRSGRGRYSLKVVFETPDEGLRYASPHRLSGLRSPTVGARAQQSDSDTASRGERVLRRSIVSRS